MKILLRFGLLHDGPMSGRVGLSGNGYCCSLDLGSRPETLKLGLMQPSLPIARQCHELVSVPLYG